MSRRRPSGRGDAGQIMLLSLAYGVLALLLVTVVVSATGVHLDRKELLAVADLAALDAADALDHDAYFHRGGGAAGDRLDGVLLLTDASVTAAVERYLADAPPDLEDLALVDASLDGGQVTVTLSARARPVLLTWVTAGHAGGIELVVTSSADAG